MTKAHTRKYDVYIYIGIPMLAGTHHRKNLFNWTISPLFPAMYTQSFKMIFGPSQCFHVHIFAPPIRLLQQYYIIEFLIKYYILCNKYLYFISSSLWKMILFPSILVSRSETLSGFARSWWLASYYINQWNLFLFCIIRYIHFYTDYNN